MSYRACLRKHLSPELERQVAGCQKVYRHPQQRFEFNLKSAQVEQGGSGQRVNQDIYVAAVCVVTPYHRTEDTWIDRAKSAPLRRARLLVSDSMTLMVS